MIVGVERPADITLVAGSSGSGKSLWTKRRVAGEPRVIVYDTDAEYCELPGFARFDTIRRLAAALKRTVRGRFAFVPASPHDPALFELWSRAAFAWGNCVAVAEELADVTSPGKAPPGWGMLIRRGRKRGVRLVAITQRPSESDKTVIGNATLLHVGALARFQDRVYMARELDVALDIMPAAPLQYLERDRATGELRRGLVALP